LRLTARPVTLSGPMGWILLLGAGVVVGLVIARWWLLPVPVVAYFILDAVSRWLVTMTSRGLGGPSSSPAFYWHSVSGSALASSSVRSTELTTAVRATRRFQTEPLP